MKTTAARLALFTSYLTLTSALASEAWAQTAPVPTTTVAQAAAAPIATNQVQEVIVTAQKRSERLSDVPVSVTALSGQQLQDAGVTHPRDLDKVVPALTFTEGQTGSPVYTIRGIGFYALGIGISPAVSVYQNQVPLPFPRMTEGAALDVARVEVLKGPQGTLFGENSTGGAINYIPAAPTSDYEAAGNLTYGRFNEVDVDGYVSGPITNTLRARLSFDTEHRDDWQYNYVASPAGESNQGNGQRDFSTGRLLLDWQAAPTLKWEFNINGWVDKSDSQARQKIAYSPTNPDGYAGYPGYPNVQAMLQAYPNAPNNDRAAGFYTGNSLRRNDSFYQGSANGQWTITPRITLTSITAISQLHVSTPNDYAGVSFLPESYVAERGSAATDSQELRLSGERFLDGRLKWLAGFNYEYDSTKDDQFSFELGSTSGIGPFRFTNNINESNQVINTGAAFGDVEYNILRNLTAQFATRYTYVDNTYTGCLRDSGLPMSVAPAFSFLSTELSGSPTTIQPGGCATLGADYKPELVKKSLDQSNVSYRTGLSWKVTPTTLLYANVTKGYKSGAFENLPAIVASEVIADTQESVLAYETGAKLFLFGKRMEIDGALFYDDYKNKQIAGYTTFPVFGTLPSLVSIPRSHVDGAELSVVAKPFERLTVRLGGAYVETRVDSDFATVGAVDGGNVDIKGESFPNAPKWQVNADVQYDIPVTEDLSGFVGGNVHYEGSTTGAFAGGPLFNIDEYALLNLRAGVETPDRRWRLELWGQNVTDKYYTTTVAHTLDTITQLTGMPATYGVTLGHKF